MTKIEESLKAQREQLEKLTQTVFQLQGSIAALEYVQSLGLMEPEPEVIDESKQTAE